MKGVATMRNPKTVTRMRAMVVGPDGSMVQVGASSFQVVLVCLSAVGMIPKWLVGEMDLIVGQEAPQWGKLVLGRGMKTLLDENESGAAGFQASCLVLW